MRPGRKQNHLYQELVVPETKVVFKNMPVAAVCHICKKGLDEGHSITAKRMAKETVFLCDLHFPN